MAAEHYDAIVVGSGITGGLAAKELTERGLRTLVLERGRNVTHGVDYPAATTPPWKIAHRGMAPRQLIAEHPVLRRARLAYEPNAAFWVNEHDCPYVETKPF